MLVHLKDVLAYAEKNQCAIGAFNTPNLENLQAVLTVAEAKKVPIIVAHAQIHEPYAPLSFIGPVMVKMAELSSVPVCVHLDHGTDLAYIEKALQIGFTSLMYDGSLLPYEENIANTIEARKLAYRYGADIEAEVGVVGGRLPDAVAALKPEALYTDPSVAKDFVEKTGIDALACGFGTVHGIYKEKPHLSFETVRRCRETTNGTPIVMHGGSGVSPEDYRKAIQAGIRKINYYTYMSKAGLQAAKLYIQEHPENVFYHEVATAAMEAMTTDIEKAVNVFYSLRAIDDEKGGKQLR